MLDTTIRLSVDTRQKLFDLGKKGMTYDEIINQLISKGDE